MTEINYSHDIVPEDKQYKAVIKANDHIIHVSQGFEFELDAERYADGYHKGFVEGIIHFANNFGKIE